MSTSHLHRMAVWARSLRLADVPSSVREQAKNQVLSMLAAVYSGYDSELGPLIERAFPSPGPGEARALPSPLLTTPDHAAFLMAAWSMVLDYDDVMLGGHPGHSSVLVPFAFAGPRRLSGAQLLLAQIVANEIAARINLAVALGTIRGQMASHLHLVGAAAARAHLEGLAVEPFAQALAFALSYPAQALYPAFLGSDAKALCAAWPVRMGIESVEAVRAGLRAPPRVLEDERGFLHTFARIPLPEVLGDLGERWHTETDSFKVHPVCGYLSGVIEATLSLVRRHAVAAEAVERVDVHGSLFTVGMEAHSRPYLQDGDSPLSTLTFSTAFTVASALVHGCLTPAQLTRPAVQDPRVWELVKKVHLHHDPGLTLTALTCDIPIGAALQRAGRRRAFLYLWGLGTIAFGRGWHPALAWTKWRLAWKAAAAAGRGRPPSTKRLGARVEIHTREGRRLAEAVDIPEGFAGFGSWPAARRLMREKYVACAAPHLGDRAEEAAEQIARLEALDPDEVRSFLDLGRGEPPLHKTISLYFKKQ